MSVSKIIAGNDIVNGGSVIMTGAGPAYYNDGTRTRVLTTATGVRQFDIIAARNRGGRWAREQFAASGECATPLTGDAVIGYSGVIYQNHVIGSVAYSFDGTPSSGNLKVESPAGTTLFSVDVTAKGPLGHEFEGGLRGNTGQDLIVTLAGGGSGVKPKLSIQGHVMR